MNRSALVLLTASLAVALAVGAAACGGTNPNPGPQGNDSGTQQETDSGTPGVDSGTQEDSGVEADSGVDTDAGSDVDAGTVDDAGTVTDAGAPNDAGTPADGGFTGVKCGGTTCSPGLVCCGGFADGGPSLTCAASCADGGVTIGCDGPEDCSSGTPVCCGTVQIIGTFPACSMGNVTADCAATCTPNVPLTCPAQGEVVACHAKADCAAYAGYTDCCTFGQGNNTSSVCSSPAMKLAAGNNCAP